MNDPIPAYLYAPPDAEGLQPLTFSLWLANRMALLRTYAAQMRPEVEAACDVEGGPVRRSRADWDRRFGEWEAGRG